MSRLTEYIWVKIMYMNFFVVVVELSLNKIERNVKSIVQFLRVENFS